MLNEVSSLDLAHEFVSAHINKGDICIDATAGKGRDTAFLCRLVGNTGRVYAFDIQKDALRQTEELLKNENLLGRVTLINDGHQNMDKYVFESVDGVIFNFGWLPGGNHLIQTKAKTSIEAIRKAMELIREGGIISLCIYYGHESGFDERDKLIEFIKTIDPKQFGVIMHEFINRPNCPPIVVDIQKNTIKK